MLDTYAIKVILELLGMPLAVAQSLLLLIFAKSGVIVNPILYIFYNKEVINTFIIDARGIRIKIHISKRLNILNINRNVIV